MSNYDGGYIKLFRQMKNWEWYMDTPTKVLFIHILLSVNWEDGRYKGVDIPAGSMTTSIKALAKETHLSVHQVRTALNHLISTNEVAIKTSNKYTLITVEKWENFQSDELRYDKLVDNLNGKEVANKWQTSGKQVATNKEEKENKKNKNNKNNDVGCEKRSEFLFVNQDESLPYEIALKCENLQRKAQGMELL